jgi:hypothetical protein
LIFSGTHKIDTIRPHAIARFASASTSRSVRHALCLPRFTRKLRSIPVAADQR